MTRVICQARASNRGMQDAVVSHHAPTAPAYGTTHDGDSVLPTHRHCTPYLSLVVAGSYVEVSPDGPLQCRPGTVVLHPPFHAHGDRFGRRGARTLNLELTRVPSLAPFPEGAQAWQVDDPVAARELFLHAPTQLPELLGDAVLLAPAPLPVWQTEMAAAVRDADVEITAIARHAGVSAEHASRSFAASHGMSPRALRGEWRWRRALSLLAGDLPLAQVAAAAGYADQSHLCRVSLRLAGCSPARVRERIKCVQYAGNPLAA
ncbi:hypothetical protein GCM10027191_18780 [Novilysobacter erysipheiresistens]